MRIVELLESKGGSVETVSPADPISVAVEALADRGFGALVASDDGNTIDGILSERDIVRSLAASGKDTLDTLVGDLMTKDVVTCKPDHTVDTLMAIMTGNRIRHVPVVDDGKLVGIVSIGDVVNVHVQELEEAATALHDYIALGR